MLRHFRVPTGYSRHKSQSERMGGMISMQCPEEAQLRASDWMLTLQVSHLRCLEIS